MIDPNDIVVFRTPDGGCVPVYRVLAEHMRHLLEDCWIPRQEDVTNVNLPAGLGRGRVTEIKNTRA